MRKRWMALALATTVVASVTWAQGEAAGDRNSRRLMWQGGGRGQDGGDQESILQELMNDPAVATKAGISEQQMATLKTGFEGLKPDLERLRKELEKAGIDQAALMTKPGVDEAALMTAVEHTGAVRTELAKLQVKALLLVRQTLAADQVEKVRGLVREKMRERFAERMRDMRGRNGQGGPGGKEAKPGEKPPAPPPPPVPDNVL